jgi:hypothetical protein
LGASRRIHPAGLRSAADPSHPQNTKRLCTVLIPEKLLPVH